MNSRHRGILLVVIVTVALGACSMWLLSHQKLSEDVHQLDGAVR